MLGLIFWAVVIGYFVTDKLAKYIVRQDIRKKARENGSVYYYDTEDKSRSVLTDKLVIVDYRITGDDVYVIRDAKTFKVLEKETEMLWNRIEAKRKRLPKPPADPLAKYITKKKSDAGFLEYTFIDGLEKIPYISGSYRSPFYKYRDDGIYVCSETPYQRLSVEKIRVHRLNSKPDESEMFYALFDVDTGRFVRYLSKENNPPRVFVGELERAMSRHSIAYLTDMVLNEVEKGEPTR